MIQGNVQQFSLPADQSALSGQLSEGTETKK